MRGRLRSQPVDAVEEVRGAVAAEGESARICVLLAEPLAGRGRVDARVDAPPQEVALSVKEPQRGGG